MRVDQLELRRFRNLADQAVAFDPRSTILWGDNGQGKTNVLEAVYLLATLKLFRDARNQDLIRHGDADATLRGEVADRGLVRVCGVRVDRASRRATLDGKDPRSLPDYFAVLRAVAFTPADLALLSGPPDSRRGFLDRAAFTLDPSHLECVREFRAALAQKNALLRGARGSGSAPDDALLDAWDERLVAAAAQLTARRTDFLRDFGPLFRETHDGIAGTAPGRAELRYRACVPPDVLQGSAPAIRETLSQRIRSIRPREIERGFALVGPQREDWEIHVGGRALRTFGSQGQVRSAVLALRVAQVLLAARRGAEPPVLLLDDVSSELDASRNRRLLESVQATSAQLVITTTDLSNLRGWDAPGRACEVRGGRIGA